jgi:hypothetical protein
MSSSNPIHLHLTLPQPALAGEGAASPAPIHITLALCGGVDGAAVAAAPAQSRSLRTVVAAAAVFVLTAGVGWLVSGHGGGAVEPAHAALATGSDDADAQAVLEQLKMPPRIIPPPGPASAGKLGGPAAFGLH